MISNREEHQKETRRILIVKLRFRCPKLQFAFIIYVTTILCCILYSLLLRVAKLCRVSSLQKNLFNHLAKFKHLFNRTVIGSKPQQYIQDVPASFGEEFSEKSLNVTKGEKIRESLFDIKTKQCKLPFNLTNYLTKNYQNSIFRRNLIFSQKLVGTHCR